MHGGSKIQIIMIVTLIPGIESISGTANKKSHKRLVFTTRKAPSTNPNKIRAYIRSAASYQRSSPPSDAELAARELFKRRREYVQELLSSGKCKTNARAWQIAKKEIKS